MSFVKLEYIYFILPIVIIVGYLMMRFFRHSYRFVELYWFYVPKKKYLLSKLLLALSMLFIIVSLLDLRGGEEILEAQVPEVRTIILLDASASMLAEDVKPNRFQRALFLARHFVRQAAGHKISIVLFSDIQKKIVPFTDDHDLLDARIDGLKTLDISNGGTNFAQALLESVQYLKVEASKLGSVAGNIVVFTDAEAHDKEVPINIDEGITVSIVAVGTARGAQIPIRNQNGIFQGYKKFNNEIVVTKIDENYLKDLAERIANYRYWVASSYSMPTDEILSFITNSINEKSNTQDVRARPILSKYLIIPAIMIYFISTVLGLGKTFRPLTTFILFYFLSSISISTNIQAQGKQATLDDKEEIKMRPDTQKLFDKHFSGELSSDGALKLAEMLLQDGKLKDGATLYDEMLGGKESIDLQSQFNWATSKILDKNYKNGVDIYLKLYDALKSLPPSDKVEKMKDFVRSNLLTLVEQKKQEEQQQQENQQDQEQNQDNQDNQDKGEGEEQNKQDKKGQKDKEQTKDQKGQKDKEEEEKEENDQDKNQEDKKQEQQQNKDGEEKKDEKSSKPEEYINNVEQRRTEEKVPAVIKQIMSDDRTLQEKHIDTKTDSRRMNQKRDW